MTGYEGYKAALGWVGSDFRSLAGKVREKRRATLAGGHALGVAFVGRGGIERGRTGGRRGFVASYAGCGIVQVRTRYKQHEQACTRLVWDSM